jgi:2-alkyl-3-oxoalkanoate reductase
MSMKANWIVSTSDPILVSGANGFIGSAVVRALLNHGFQDVRALIRPGSPGRWKSGTNGTVVAPAPVVIEGNLLSQEDCVRAVAGVKVIIHLAAGADKSFAGSFFSSVVGTRNLLVASASVGKVRRFVNVSSFAVYSNWKLPRGGLLDERCDIEKGPEYRHEPYCYAKAQQDQLVEELGGTLEIPYVIVRPGAVFGPGSRQYLTPRIGIDTFGIYLHLGGGNQIPLTFVDNCAEAIVLAALVEGVEGEVFNIVDDDLPSSREFLRLFKANVKRFRSIYVPYRAFYLFSYLWEKYSVWSNGQFPPIFNRQRCAAYWKGNRYSNAKAKQRLGWTPKVPLAEAARLHFEYFKNSSLFKQ